MRVEHPQHPCYSCPDEELPVARPGDISPLSRDRGGHPDADLVRVRHRHDVCRLPALYRPGANQRTIVHTVADMLPGSERTHPGRPAVLPRPDRKSPRYTGIAAASSATAG